MEWPLTINEIFDEQVTRITGAAMLPKNFSADVRTSRAVQDQIGQLIDQLGKESATAQGLNKVITSAEKLRLNPAHIVYLLKDPNGDKGNGEIIGLLKVGRKHLFLFDTKETVHEIETLCVLDFYIVGHKQRLGFGRLLFDFMLHELEVTASQMAIDGPSDKMELFLSRNYGITKLLRQSNNFAVAPSFFERTDQEISNTGRNLAVEPAAAIGRFAATKPASAIANVIHGAGYDDTTRRWESYPEPYVEELWSDREISPASLRVQAGAQPADMPAAGMPSAAATHSWTGGTPEPYVEEHWSDLEPARGSEPYVEEHWSDLEPARGSEPYVEEHWSDLEPARGSEPYVEEHWSDLEPARGSEPYVEEHWSDLEPARGSPRRRSPTLERPASLRVQAGAQPAEVPAAGMPSAAATPSGTGGARDPQLTDKGYFDVKYFHNRLW